jgi:multiple sugar transport system ATP-binding protein
MAQISLKDVSKIYKGGVKAVDAVNLGIENKEFMVLVGPSGCGKSTTLRMIAGLEEITEGKIWIGDSLVNNIPAKDRDISMVFQNYALYPHMTIFENMAFGLKLRKYPKAEIIRRVNEATEILGIKKLVNRRPKQLSGGGSGSLWGGRLSESRKRFFLMSL